MSTETVQSQFSDLYGNHLNVEKDRTNRWTATHTTGVKYPRIYDYFDGKYNFASYNPMDSSIIDAVYLKNNSWFLKLLLIQMILFHSHMSVHQNL